MTIRESLVQLIGGSQLRQQREAEQATVKELYNAYQMGRFRITPDQLVEQLREYSGSTVMQLVRQLQGQTGWYMTDTEDARAYQVEESRQQWLYSPLAQWCVNTWTSYGLGEKVTVTCKDDEAQELWDEVWQSSAVFDDDAIHSLSDYVLVNGDVYLAAFISIADGLVSSFELINSDEITEIITNPDNANQPLYYKREYTDKGMVGHVMYYPDWHTYFYHDEMLEKAALPSDAMITVSEAMDQNDGTTILILHIAHNRKDSTSLHGWPILGIAAPYFAAHKEFVETRLTVARNKASFVREITHQGGSRATAALKGKLGTGLPGSGDYTDTNPAPVGGSTLIHNAGITHTDLPMTTGAGDADTDNDMFAWMAGIGAGLFPTTMGLDTSRWATAVAMDKTQAVQWARYQSFWACQFRKCAEIVMLAAETWGNAKFQDDTVNVSIDTLSLVDFPGVVQPISQMLNAIGGLVADGTLPEQAARKIARDYLVPTLSALGAEDVGDILSDELMGILTDEEREQAKTQRGAMAELALKIWESRKIAEKAAEK